MEEEMSCIFNVTTTDTYRIDQSLKTLLGFMLSQMAQCKSNPCNKFAIMKVVNIAQRWPYQLKHLFLKCREALNNLEARI